MTPDSDPSEAPALTEYRRTVQELSRVKPGDSLTRFDPALDEVLIWQAAETSDVDLLGYELHDALGVRVLVGHVNEVGSTRGRSGSAPRIFYRSAVVAARKAWLG